MNLDLTHLETLLAAATPGPWEIVGPEKNWLWTVKNPKGHPMAWAAVDCPEMFSLEDTEAVVALRNAAPALIARVKELEANEDKIREALGNGADEALWPPGVSWVDAVQSLANPQIATVVDPDTGFTINGPEWNALPLKARLIIQELQLQNDVLNEELSFIKTTV